MSLPTTPSPVERIPSSLMDRKGIVIYIKRDDLIHPLIMGNKWRKLKFNIQYAKDRGFDTIATYGGAYSNHIIAVASACELYGLKSIGIIRGNELNQDSNPTLKLSAKKGMHMVFVNRQDYLLLKNNQTLPYMTNKRVLILPEGGTNELAIRGCEEVLEEIDFPFDTMCCPYGTGGTAAGLLSALPNERNLWIFSSLKGDQQGDEFSKLLETHSIEKMNYRFFPENHFGGYAKFKPELIDFINSFYSEFRILLDPIYTGKMFFSVWELAKNDQIAPNSRLLLIHTGGLQGIAGFNHRYNLALPKPEVL